MASRSIRYKSLSIRTPRFVGVGVGDDNDAAAFLQEAGIADYMQQRAIFELVSRLKGAGLWSKMKAIYPFIGGTASTHKWNLKDPQDTDAAGRITFNGGWTHNANGITGNGTNTIANTNRTPLNYVADGSSHLSIYHRSDINAPNASPDIGAYNTGNSQAHLINTGNNTNVYDIVAYQAPQNQIAATNTTPKSGFWVLTRTDTTTMKGFRNNAQLGSTNTNTSAGFTSIQNTNYVIGSATNSGGGYTSRNYAFATIGDGITDTEASALYDIVDLYQKRLDRAV